MIDTVPSGVTVAIGRKEYRAGMKLPANASERIKNFCAERAAKVAGKIEPVKPVSVTKENDGK